MANPTNAQSRKELMTESEIGKIIIESALKVHKSMGPGLLELVYEVVLADELEQRGLKVQRQVPIPIEYEGINFQEGFLADLVVEDKVIVEFKSVEKVTKAHKEEVQTYLKLTGQKLGFLLNFNTELMTDGITRIVNGLEE